MNMKRIPLLIGIIALTVATSSCDSLDRRGPSTPTTPATTSAKPAPPPPKPRTMSELLIGKWRMIQEATADGNVAINTQGRRLLELRADKTYHVENYINAFDNTFRLDGDVLTLDRKKGEAVEIKVEKVDEKQLVLIEHTPEIYLRGGPPRKVRNTYRRVSEKELGPMLGEQLITSTPTSGAYAASYEYGMTKYPTMEIYIRRGVVGRARLELLPDHTVAGCVGVTTGGKFSRSKYSSPDGKHHTTEDNDYWLAGFEGKWKPRKKDALVRISKYWPGTCDREGKRGEILGAIEMKCVTLQANQRLPVDTLACQIEESYHLLDELALNPADTERSGPYTLQSDPMRHISTDHGRPWWLLGAEPGLKIFSKDDRDTISPEVTFKKGPIDFLERRFIRPKPRPEQ